LALVCFLVACSTGKMGEPATLHAVQIVEVLSRTDIMGSQEIHGSLHASGISDGSIVDGSVVVARLLCCGPANTANPHGFYNLDPKSLQLSVGDVIEVRLGGNSQVNEVTRMLQPASQTEGPCGWEPKDERLWRRVMFCDWMPSQGWVKQEGLYTGWYKPTISTAGATGQ
jgi:hypothetical protein